MSKRYVSVPLVITVMALVGLVGYAKTDDTSRGDQHRFEVSKFVQDLNKVAGRDSNIGVEVRDVAKVESDTASKSADDMDSIDHRNSLVTFLFGTDYKRIGTLRSKLVKSQNSINRLTKAMGKTTSVSVKADLQKQIDALNATIDKINQFIKANEGKFSILGWAVKPFSGQ